MMPLVRLLVTLGLQSVRAHRTKSLIVGGLMALGAFLLIVGGAVQASIERAMRTSITSSVTGDLQVYDKNAKDKLAILGGMGFGSEDIGEIARFDKVREAVSAVPNVKAVVPMGIANGTVSTPGDLDRALNELRNAVRDGDAERRASWAARVRRIVGVMLDQQKNRAALSESRQTAEESAVLERAASDELWAQLETDPLPVLDWLDVKLAPLGDAGGVVYLRMVGTDLQAFSREFPKMKIVDGTMVPPGQRGLLIGKKFVDRRVKAAVAMNLDSIKEDLDAGKTIAGEKVLQELVARNVKQYNKILYYLSPSDMQAVGDALRAELKVGADVELAALLQQFLNVDDASFARRYQLFYELIAPRIQLYPFKVGDTITLTSFTKTGYARSINIKVYGTYAFEGLESSDLAGALSLIDVMSFRELYGQRTAELDAELKKMRDEIGAKAVSRDDAESALFGGDSALVEEAKETKSAAGDEKLDSRVDRQRALDDQRFSQQQVDEGMVLTSAVILKDPAQLRSTMLEIQTVVEPLGLQVVDWQQASGLIGQFVWVVRGVLGVAILVIFLVAIVIINNSMVMATLERVAEIGTLRALGAQKWFVTAMILFETGVLGLIAGGGGALLSVAFVQWLHSAGIPAGNDVLQFLFGGPKLYPSVAPIHVGVGLIVTTIVSVIATLYPAVLATRVAPVVAMQGKE